MNRRHFLRNGIWVAATPFIFVPRLRGQINIGKVASGSYALPAAGVVPPPSCSTAHDNNGSTAATTYAFPQFGNICIWTPITFTSGYAVCRIDLTVASLTGLPGWTWTAAIYNMSAGKPSTINGNASVTTAATAAGVVSFTGIGTNHINSGTQVAIVYQASASDNNNFVNIQAVGSFSGGLSGYSADCSTWTDTSLNFPLQNTLYATS